MRSVIRVRSNAAAADDPVPAVSVKAWNAWSVYHVKANVPKVDLLQAIPKISDVGYFVELHMFLSSSSMLSLLSSLSLISSSSPSLPGSPCNHWKHVVVVVNVR